MSNLNDFRILKNGTLKKYSGNDTVVTIPEGVTKIDDKAFIDCGALERVIIPDGVTSIGEYAFCRCKKLENITIPDSVTEIGTGAFLGCCELKCVTIPNGVTTLKFKTFGWCENLTNITIPNSVTSIGLCAFEVCKKLESVTIPDSVTEIGNSAFSRCYELKYVTISNNVTKIGETAFYYCTKLESVIIPDSVTEIGNEAFAGCQELKNVTVPDGLRFLSTVFNKCGNLVDDNGFRIVGKVLCGYFGKECDVTVPRGISRINDGAFRPADSFLRSVTIPNSVTSIGEYAFYNCEKLESVTISDSVTEIGEHAFCLCKNLKSIVIPDSVKTVGQTAFYHTGIESLVVEGAASIQKYAFSGCDNLKSIKLSDSAQIAMSFGDYISSDELVQMLLPYHKSMTDATLKNYIFLRYWEKLDNDMVYDIFIHHQKKPALDFYVTSIKNPKGLGKRILASLPETMSAKECTLVVNYITLFPVDENKEIIQKLYTLLKSQKNSNKYVEQLEKNSLVKPLLHEGNKQKLSEIESKLKTATQVQNIPLSGLSTLIKNFYGLTNEKLPTLKDINGKAVPSQVLLYLLVAHSVSNIDGRIQQNEQDRADIHPEVADIIALIDADSLQSAMLKLAKDYLGSDNKKQCLAYPICRYANDATMAKLTAMAPQWRSASRGNDTPPFSTFRDACCYNNTRVAMMFVDKYGWLWEYASIRGTDEDTIRDMYLSDVGLDPKGRREYDLGNQTVTAVLQKDLSLLVELPDGKTAKSIPKKGTDEAKYVEANEHFTEMKKSIKKIVKNRKDNLFGDFLSGNARKASDWQAAYMDNPLLRSVGELLVWQQGKSTFTIGENGLITVDGSPYTLSDKKIAVAHPLEMTKGDIAAWQQYFVSHGLKQPFEQVWEPVVNAEDVSEDRYAGCMIPYYRFVGQAKRGITVTDFNYHDDIEIDVEDCRTEIERIDWERHMINMSDRFEIQKFAFKKLTRQVNHIIAYFDRITVYERIRKDDVSVKNILSQFTLAQIADFIKVANENNAVNVSALLLNYKNEHFADFDPMDEFVLE